VPSLLPSRWCYLSPYFWGVKSWDLFNFRPEYILGLTVQFHSRQLERKCLMTVVCCLTELTNCIARWLSLRKRVRERMSSCDRISMTSSAGSLSSWSIASGDGCAIVAAIIERTVFFELRIVQGVVADFLLPVYTLREIEWIFCFHCRAALRSNLLWHVIHIFLDTVIPWDRFIRSKKNGVASCPILTCFCTTSWGKTFSYEWTAH